MLRRLPGNGDAHKLRILSQEQGAAEKGPTPDWNVRGFLGYVEKSRRIFMSLVL